MGNITVTGLDEAVLMELKVRAEHSGVTPETYAAEFITRALRNRHDDRVPVSRAVLAAQRGFSSISSVDLLRQIRDETA